MTEELERIWAFYRNESDKCASKPKISGRPRHFHLPSTPAPPEAGRRGLHLKNFLPPHGAAPVLVTRAAVTATRAAAVVAAATALAFPRRRIRLSWMTQTCSTAARSFRLVGCCVRPLRSENLSNYLVPQHPENGEGWTPVGDANENGEAPSLKHLQQEIQAQEKRQIQKVDRCSAAKKPT